MSKLLTSTALVLILTGNAKVFAAEKRDCAVVACTGHVREKADDNSTTESVETGANTETDSGNAMFSISVDGEHVAGTKQPANAQRKTDVSLENVDIQVKFDGLDAKTILNVSTFPIRQSYNAGDRINFLASNNYPAWITKAEIRIYKADEQSTGIARYTTPVTPDGAASWVMPEDAPQELVYVLRVYDNENRFDETLPLPLTRTSKSFEQHAPQDGAVAPGYGDDRTAIRNIPVFGGAVTVYGRNVPSGNNVTVLGDSIPVDVDNAFVVQRILPPGDHNVDVAVLGKKGKGFAFNRSINIPSSDWFYVGLADVTVGKRFGSGKVEAVKPGEFKNIYTKGRLAFYVKGKIKGEYLLTAAADTGEDKLSNLFKGLDAKDPKQFLRRINPNDYYPIYGDDSTTVEDAPTRGKFYVRLAKGDSHVMWGNFKTEIRGTELLRNERALYGAEGVYKSDTATSFGERRTQATVYAAQPGTLPQRDELRGTGGSAYFLKQQDITIGSETITVEIRDRVTGRMLSRKTLAYGTDFSIDYLQGVIILKSPLSSAVSDGDVVRDGSLGGNDVFLIANYEYTPVAGEVNGYVFGGRAQQWIGEHVRVGVTGASEKTGAADQKLYGADIQLRKSERSFIEVEVARSKGPGFGNSTSADGGLTISNTPTAGLSGKSANAVRVHGRAGLEEFTDGNVKGDLEAYYDHAQNGFSTLGRQVTSAETNWGAKGDFKFAERSKATLSYDEHRLASGKNDREFNAQVAVGLDEHWTLTPGVKNTRRDQTTGTDTGSRTDIGGKVAYDFDDDHSVYLFGQATVHRSGTRRKNNRVGIGGETLLAEKVGLNAEVSTGNGGIGAAATLDYKPTADDHYYMGYRLDSDREYGGSFPSVLQGNDPGSIVLGAKHKFSDRLSVYSEDNSELFGKRRSLTQTYGVTYTPSAEWTVGGGVEVGTIWDDSINATSGLKNSDFDRTAVSASVGYVDGEHFEGHLKGEARFENSEDGTRDRNSYLLQAGVNVKTSEDWRILANLDAVISEASTTTLDGNYIEGALGYAYRPIDNDRFNALFKYTFLYDFPGADQVTVNGTANGAAQRSHIISADSSYDLTEIFTIGGKYGARFGESKDRIAPSSWVDNSAQLGIIRLDMHVVKNWDALVEGRVLWTSPYKSADYGALAAVYRHMGDNFKIGVGYNFGRFSDDLRDLVADDHGVFINAIGKF